ncbi:MAG TPA: hypothetical protein VH279_02580 [Solirubrobacteraceae bacterium]|nr:hypothetical protein [Solirubrobacteraceae bacterium]
MHVVSTIRRIAAPLGLALALFVLGAGSANASLLVDDGANCSDYTYSQVFLPWADPAYYTPVPGGDFEKANKQWDLIGASRVTNENESFKVAGITHHSSLSIPDGATALSPAMCVGLAQPTLRMFFKQNAGLGLARLRVDVLFDDVSGTTQAQSIGWVGAINGWSPSQQMAILANILPTIGAGSSAVAFRFTSVGGDFQIDDVYVDPWSRG